MKAVYLTAKMIQIIIVHDLQLTSAWIRSWKTRAEHCILLFSLFYVIKEIVLVLCDFFPEYIYRAGGSVYEVS